MPKNILEAELMRMAFKMTGKGMPVVLFILAVSPKLIAETIPLESTVFPLAKALNEHPDVADLRDRLDEITGTQLYVDHLTILNALQVLPQELVTDVQKLNDDDSEAHDKNDAKIREKFAELSMMSRGLLNTYEPLLKAGGFTVMNSGQLPVLFHRKKGKAVAVMPGLEKETNGYFAVATKDRRTYRLVIGATGTPLEEGMAAEPVDRGYGEMVLMPANEKGEWAKPLSLDPKAILRSEFSTLQKSLPELSKPMEIKFALVAPSQPGHYRFIKIEGASVFSSSPCLYFHKTLTQKTTAALADIPINFVDPYVTVKSKNVEEGK